MKPHAILALTMTACGGAPFVSDLFTAAPSAADAGLEASSDAGVIVIVDAAAQREADVVTDPTDADDIHDVQPTFDSASPSDACAPTEIAWCVNSPTQKTPFQAPSQLCYLNAGPNVEQTPPECICDYTCDCIAANDFAFPHNDDGGLAIACSLNEGGITLSTGH